MMALLRSASAHELIKVTRRGVVWYVHKSWLDKNWPRKQS